MSLRRRVIMMASLALSLWYVWDAIHCLTTGRFVSRVLTEAQAAVAEGVVVPLEDGTLVEYGPWALAFTSLGLHPNLAAPLFLVVGLLGFFGLGLFLARRPLGWTLLLAFAIASLAYAYLGTLIAALLVVVLLLPGTRREVFGARASEAEGLSLAKADEPGIEQG